MCAIDPFNGTAMAVRLYEIDLKIKEEEIGVPFLHRHDAACLHVDLEEGFKQYRIFEMSRLLHKPAFGIVMNVLLVFQPVSECSSSLHICDTVLDESEQQSSHL